MDYIDNKYALRKDAPPINCRWKNKSGDIIEQPFDIQRKKFKNLPLILQKQILEYKLTTYSYENFTDEELDGIVYSVNNGKQPTPFHKLRFALGTENMRLIQPLCNYVLWEDVKKCSAKNDSVLGCVIRIIMICTYNHINGLSTSAMARFVKDFSDKIKTSHIRKIKELIEQFGDIADKMTDAEFGTLDSCNIPHYIANLRYFNELCSKHSTDETEGKSYLDFFRAFLNSEEYSVKFSAYKAKGIKAGSGGTQYSADSVEERQNIIDSYLEEFLDFPLEYNGIFRHNAITDSEVMTCSFFEQVTLYTDFIFVGLLWVNKTFTPREMRWGLFQSNLNMIHICKNRLSTLFTLCKTILKATLFLHCNYCLDMLK